MDFDKLHDEIIETDKSIHHVVILSNNGEKICGRYRKEITPMLNDEILNLDFQHIQIKPKLEQNLTKLPRNIQNRFEKSFN
ncbi:MAG: hypothetical protein OEL81_06335 [Nitrosopumilus sp.]|nr:hypothetical protein [Nitrosopumilus sp.]